MRHRCKAHIPAGQCRFLRCRSSDSVIMSCMSMAEHDDMYFTPTGSPGCHPRGTSLQERHQGEVGSADACTRFVYIGTEAGWLAVAGFASHTQLADPILSHTMHLISISSAPSTNKSLPQLISKEQLSSLEVSVAFGAGKFETVRDSQCQKPVVDSTADTDPGNQCQCVSVRQYAL